MDRHIYRCGHTTLSSCKNLQVLLTFGDLDSLEHTRTLEKIEKD